VLLARVTQVKRKGEVTYVGIETGMNSLLRPALYGAHHAIVNLSRLDEPASPTWMADRMHSTQRRVQCRYQIDLAVVWPHLWSVTTDPLRTDVEAAQERYVAAGRLTGWSLLYLGLGVVWWPFALLAPVLAVSSWWQAREAVTQLATLVETTADMSIRKVTDELGIAPFDADRLRDLFDPLTAARR